MKIKISVDWDVLLTILAFTLCIISAVVLLPCVLVPKLMLGIIILLNITILTTCILRDYFKSKHNNGTNQD